VDLNQVREMIIFKASSIFEASGAVAKIESILKLNHHKQI
jgi:hypothetical protein